MTLDGASMCPSKLIMAIRAKKGACVMLPALPLTTPPTTATFDHLFDWYLFFGVGAAVIVISMVLIFSFKYRDRGETTPMPKHKVEGWKVVLITLMISISVLSAAEYQTFASFSNIEIPTGTAAANAVHIDVEGFQWGWNFTYPNGKYQLGNLTVPANTVVILNITSKDVFHSFGIPFLAVKADAIPGRVNQLWFEVPAGTVIPFDPIRCFELCGVGHAYMIANMSLVSVAAWNAWMAGGPGTVPTG